MQWKFFQGPHLYAQADLGTGMQMEQHITKKQKRVLMTSMPTSQT